MLTLSPQARAVTAFALAFMLVTGYLYHFGSALIDVFNGDPAGRTHARLVGFAMLLVGIGVLWLAGQASATAPDTWTRALAEASRFLAAIGLIIIVLGLLSTFTQDGDGPSYFFGY